ncbi:flagellar hook assembly protein FlgD [Sinomonas halotolerans]|uniref:Flagellar hook capping FlgD N-terminal domain-containing protein n=1 Tax=Sinomonas halotolerans TaxID=1644133 RepID=A0ABU9WYQ2_9MICC
MPITPLTQTLLAPAAPSATPLAPATGAAGIGQGPARSPKQEMDGELFMQLLVTQLKNQDPSSPMDTTQMIEQTASLAQMEKLTELAATAKSSAAAQALGSAAALIGRTVEFAGPDGVPGSGRADHVTVRDGVASVSVGGTEVPLASVTGVR